jgi:hypothetical protein
MASGVVESAERREMIDAVQTAADALHEVGIEHHALVVGQARIADEVVSLRIELIALRTAIETRNKIDERELAAETLRITTEAEVEKARIVAAKEERENTDHGMQLAKRGEEEAAKRSDDVKVLIIKTTADTITNVTGVIFSRPAIALWTLMIISLLEIAGHRGPAWALLRVVFPQLLGANE